MSKQLKPLFRNLLWLGGLAGLVVVVILMLRNTRLTQTAQAPEPTPVPLSTATPTPAVFSSPFDSPIETPTPEATVTSAPPPTETPWVEPPTPTIPPVPTPLSTPVVTSIPTAQPPIIPLPTIEATEPYTIVFRDGNALRAIDGDGANERILIDIRAESSLFLADQRLGVRSWEWGDPSPDGNQLALVLSNVETRESLPKGESPMFDIYLFNSSTGSLQLLIQDGLEPVWSPGGNQIAYRSVETSGLWIIDVDTGETQEIYAVDRENEHFITNIDWAPNGKYLVFLDQVFGGPYTIMVINADGTEPATALLPATMYPLFFPQWSPVGNKILFVSLAGKSSEPLQPYNLWLIDSDGTNQAQLTQDISLSGGPPQWSPDGLWIAFAGTRYYEDIEPFVDLWLVDRPGSELKRLTSDTAKRTNISMPAWSPDGSRVIFSRERSELWQISLSDGIHSKFALTSAISDFFILTLP